MIGGAPFAPDEAIVKGLKIVFAAVSGYCLDSISSGNSSFPEAIVSNVF